MSVLAIDNLTCAQYNEWYFVYIVLVNPPVE